MSCRVLFEGGINLRFAVQSRVYFSAFVYFARLMGQPGLAPEKRGFVAMFQLSCAQILPHNSQFTIHNSAQFTGRFFDLLIGITRNSSQPGDIRARSYNNIPSSLGLP